MALTGTNAQFSAVLCLNSDIYSQLHLTTQFFTSWKLGLMPNKQYESTEGKLSSITLLHVVILLVVRMSVVLVAAASLMVTYCNVI